MCLSLISLKKGGSCSNVSFVSFAIQNSLPPYGFSHLFSCSGAFNFCCFLIHGLFLSFLPIRMYIITLTRALLWLTLEMYPYPMLLILPMMSLHDP